MLLSGRRSATGSLGRANPDGFGGLLCSAALLTKYTSLVLIPAIALQMIVTQHKRYWAYLLIPIGALVAWSLFNIADFGHSHLFGRSAGGSGGKLHWGQLRLIFWWIGILGAICPFVLALLIAQYQQASSQLAKRGWLFLILSSAIAPCLVIICIAIQPSARWIDLIFNYAFLEWRGFVGHAVFSNWAHAKASGARS